jgi:hypothetical protein
MVKNSLEIKIGNEAEESFKKLFTFVKKATKEELIIVITLFAGFGMTVMVISVSFESSLMLVVT